MQIKRLVIENFKSIERIELVEPNPFTVFVGPNGSGKSNIFEALEFNNRSIQTDSTEALRLHGGANKVLKRASDSNGIIEFRYDFQNLSSYTFAQNRMQFHRAGVDTIRHGMLGGFVEKIDDSITVRPSYLVQDKDVFNKYFLNFKRVFVKNLAQLRIDYQDDNSLNFAATNLEPVLRRTLQNSVLHNEISEWLNLFVPSFKAVEVDDRDELHWFEQGQERYFTKDLISDGTYNILALLTAVYQSDDKPQFLCIEEPENGLHPQVARELVDFFRTMCEERGHYIWLNTHSPYMVSRVRPDELIVVNKVDGATQVKQFKGQEFDGMRMDEAWLTNVLNGGKAW